MLKVNDRIRFTGLPKLYCPDGTPAEVSPECKRIYKKLFARKGSFRISRISWGQPWFDFKLKKRGGWEHHSLVVLDSDDNWVKVKK